MSAPSFTPDPDGFDADVEGWLPPVPDAVDLVVETATMMAVFAAQRLVRIEAMRRELLADAVGRGNGMRDVVERSIRLELAAAMRVTEYAAGRLLGVADALVNRYPQLLDALSGGRVTEKHAEIFVDLVDQVPFGLRDQVTGPGLELAQAEPVGSFRRALRDLIGRVQATTLEQRLQDAVTGRRVWMEQGADAMALLGLHHPGVEVHAIHDRITRIAKLIAAADGETRTLDQIRADVVADLLIDGTTAHLPATASGIRAQVVVTVPALSLLHADTDTDTDVDVDVDADVDVDVDVDADVYTEAAATETDAAAAAGVGADRDPRPSGHQPGEVGTVDPPVVEGIGPIPLSVARELCGGDTKWMRVLTHPETGMVLSVGRDRYEPPAALRRLVRWRADRCMAPGCNVPASRCEIDHQIRWTDGGHTCLDNNCPFCRGHHLVKDNTGWTVIQIPGSGGVIQWTSPTGRRYLVHPERRIPAFTTARTQPTPDAPF